jgi:SecD/SecF fusion protein
MQSKGVIKLLAILLAIACIYQLSFSLKARSVEKKAAEYAAKVSESDSLRQAAEI